MSDKEYISSYGYLHGILVVTPRMSMTYLQKNEVGAGGRHLVLGGQSSGGWRDTMSRQNAAQSRSLNQNRSQNLN